MNKTTSRQPLLVYIVKKIVFWFLDGYKQKGKDKNYFIH